MKNFIRKLRIEREMSIEELADMIGTSIQQISRLETGARRLNSTWIEKISAALNIDPSELFKESPDTIGIETKKIPVIGFVQAGQWQEAIEWPQDKMYYIYLPEMDEYSNKKICALEVRGDSMNKIYPEGTCVAFISIYDYQEVNGEIPSGKRVICQRKNPKDNTIEATVKEYVKNESGIFLVPHSTNLTHVPCRLDNGSCGETEITGVVVGSFRKE